MEHLKDLLIVLINKMHMPFIVGICIHSGRCGENSCLDSDAPGDNMPHVFLYSRLER